MFKRSTSISIVFKILKFGKNISNPIPNNVGFEDNIFNFATIQEFVDSQKTNIFFSY